MDMIDEIAEKYSAMVTFKKTYVQVGGGVEVTHWEHNVRELIVDAITEALTERDARIKELEAELSSIKEGAKKLPRIGAGEYKDGVLTRVLLAILVSDLDRLMKGGE